jgi:hypothetical protein
MCADRALYSVERAGAAAFNKIYLCGKCARELAEALKTLSDGASAKTDGSASVKTDGAAVKIDGSVSVKIDGGAANDKTED